MSNNYYWRAVRRLAKRKGVSISTARRMDWEKEANAERKRRSKAARGVHADTRRTAPVRKPVSKSLRVRRSGPTVRSRVRTIPKRKGVSSKRVVPKLKLKDYDRIPTRRGGTAYEDELFDESDFEGDVDFSTEWADDYESDFPELDALDDLGDFLDTFEYEDSDKYKEPS